MKRFYSCIGILGLMVISLQAPAKMACSVREVRENLTRQIEKAAAKNPYDYQSVQEVSFFRSLEPGETIELSVQSEPMNFHNFLDNNMSIFNALTSDILDIHYWALFVDERTCKILKQVKLNENP